jgi:UDP-N-acetylmuramate--alanine ligase
LQPQDYLIADVLNENIQSVVSDVNAKLVDYSSYRNMQFEMSSFGEHNKSNAGAALAVAHVLGISPRKAAESLKGFKGTWRRQELKGETKSGAIVYDDYAHHPTEIKATLDALRKKYPIEKIIVAFQPHLYSRTRDHISEFAGAFVNADKILLAPIYAAREKDDGTISSQILCDEMAKHSEDVVVFNSLSDLQSYAYETLSKGDIFVTMGAGNIYEVGEELIKN